jgi:hypothetical protein
MKEESSTVVRGRKFPVLLRITLQAAFMSIFLLSTLRVSAATFADVPSTYWAFNYIEAIYNAGITVGCSQNPLNYCPTDDVTRGQMAAFIERALNGENFTYTQMSYFSDVPADNVFFKYVQRLKDDGITAVSGAYDVDGYVTRGQMAAFIIRAKYGENFSYSQPPYFSDVPADNVFFKYVQRLKDDRITTVSGAYDVDSNVTRDQMAAFIARAFLQGDGLADNLIPVSVNGASCNAYPNEPCVSVTVCTPGTDICQTVDGILLDTGSFGLRIFKQVLNIPLTQDMTGSGSLAECYQFLSFTFWGPVETAGVILGSEPTVSVPIQVVDYTFSSIPSSCINPIMNPLDIGFNGILGIGPLVQDCGPLCATNSFGIYYACSDSTCTGTTVPLANQVPNPVSMLPQDNNGLIVQLPNVPLGGSESLRGNLVLGIGTQSNNMPPEWVTTYQTDQTGALTTIFNGASFTDSSIMDTGSSTFFFPSPFGASNTPYAGLLPDCGSIYPYTYPGAFCPPSITNLSATIVGTAGSPTGEISFQIGNADSLTSTPNEVFRDIGETQFGVFIWGMPFFIGRDTYIGFEGQTSVLGSGPFIAY